MALVTALMAVGVLALAAAGSLTLASASARSARHWNDRTGALYAAESGVNEALYRLDVNPGGVARRAYPSDAPSLESAPGFLGPDASYRVWVEDVSPRVVQVTSRGRQGGATRVVRAQIRVRGPSLFDDSFDDAPDGIIDCTDARNDPVCRAREVDVRVDDECHGHCPDGALEVPKRGTRTLGPGEYRFDKLEVKEEGRLIVEGPATLYIDRDVEIDGQASLILRGGAVTFRIRGDLKVDEKGAVAVEPTATAALWVRKDADFGRRSTLTTGGATDLYVREKLEIGEQARIGTDATLLTVYLDTDVPDKKVELKEGAAFEGGIYAPSRRVELEEGVTLEGAVVGDPVRKDPGATVTYNPDIGSGGGTGVVGGTWGEL